jgi:uncharacterized protein YjbJ (UPF0337 family)
MVRQRLARHTCDFVFAAGTCVASVAVDQPCEESQVNKDQVKGAAKDVAGKVQEKAGDVTGNEKQRAKGAGKQVVGKVQQGYGDAKEAAGDAADKAADKAEDNK